MILLRVYAQTRRVDVSSVSLARLWPVFIHLAPSLYMYKAPPQTQIVPPSPDKVICSHSLGLRCIACLRGRTFLRCNVLFYILYIDDSWHLMPEQWLKSRMTIVASYVGLKAGVWFRWHNVSLWNNNVNSKRVIHTVFTCDVCLN